MATIHGVVVVAEWILLLLLRRDRSAGSNNDDDDEDDERAIIFCDAMGFEPRDPTKHRVFACPSRKITSRVDVLYQKITLGFLVVADDRWIVAVIVVCCCCCWAISSCHRTESVRLEKGF